LVKGGHPMIGPSKILTVSYGTFSCTLEGFDDPFNTMRAIAEYFRDLAAEDRYFGAEPPTPDAAMLHKIAEREVQRRVEAKISENGVVLRTGDAMQTQSFAPAPQPEHPAPAVVFAPAATAAPAFSAAPMPDGVAAKLLRIRAAVATAELAEPRPAPMTEIAPAAPAQPILTDYSEDQHADDITTTNTLTATFAPDAFEADTADTNTWIVPEPAPQADAYDDDLSTAEPDLTAAEMLAEELVLEDEQTEDDYAEVDLSTLIDSHPAVAEPSEPAAQVADATDGAADGAADDALSALIHETATASDVAAAQYDELAEVDPADYTISEDDLDDLRALDGDNKPAAAIDTSAEEDDLSPAAETTVSTFDEDDYDDEAEDLPSDSSLETEFTEELAAETTSDPMLDEIDSVYGADTPAPTGPSEKALRARARVIKVRRDDADDAPVTKLDSAVADVAAMLAADAEADLRRELRALQQQNTSALPPSVDPDEIDDLDHETGPEDDARQRLDQAGEAAVSRLIEQTNEVMAVPENRRRLSAIAHLKAAVAATVADRFSKGDTAPKEPEVNRLEPYREDLARVVRPQHPTATDDAPVTPRPAPLVLVSAQRIDRPRTQPGDTPTNLSAVPNAPVRPRRVTSAVLAVEAAPDVDDDDEDVDAAPLFADIRGFAEFSERLGANSLAEILEAAAAYSVCIEGRPYFSRPQLMNQIGALSADSEFTREDGLRTFGALLREGRIQKIKRGQFVLTESSRYLVEARTLAG
jgi:hypothetical protein